VEDKGGIQPAPIRLSLIGFQEPQDRAFFERRLTRTEIDASELRNRLQTFLGAMEQVIGGVSATVGRYHLDTVTLTAEVSAKGTVSLLGTGAEVAGKGGLTFTFKAASGAG